MIGFALIASLFYFASAVNTKAVAELVNAPGMVNVQFDMMQLDGSKPTGTVIVTVTPSLAPLGAARFFELVQSGFFDDVATGGITFFRCGMLVFVD